MIFVTRRRPDAHQGGLWEFPGGKIGADEDVRAGLARELHEELGIDIEHARPFVRVHHRYPDKVVLLDVWRVMAWRGEPRGREGQEARWAEPGALGIAEFPAADRPVLRRLQLPPLYLISDAARYGKDGFLALLERALASGARLIQLREPQMRAEEFVAYAQQLAWRCRAHGAKLLINAEPGWVDECGADGVHLNSRRLMALTARPLGPERLVAASCHSREELVQAARKDLDFAVLSPVMRTAGHPHARPLGWERFSELAGTVALPVYALGGMHPEDLARARDSGAQGLAMIRGVWEARSLESAVQAACAQSPLASPR